jgi:pyruvate kinase
MAELILKKQGYVERRQVVGMVGGTRTKSGATNFMRLHLIGDGDAKPAKVGKAGKGTPEIAALH